MIVQGALSGQGRRRECRIQVVKTSIQVDERSGSMGFTYSNASIVDSDDFPDGDYEVTYEGGTELLTKKHGNYLTRQP